MSGLQDTTLLAHTSFGPPSRPGTKSQRKEPYFRSLLSKRSLPALTNLVRSPIGTLDSLRQGWDGLTKEERIERLRIQARKQVLYMQLREAVIYDDWRNAAVELDELEGNNSWKQEPESPEYDSEEIRIRLEQLDAARISYDARRMLFLIRTSLTRNLGNMGNLRLYSRSFVGTKDLIERYINSALTTLDTLLEMSEQGSIEDLTPKMMLDQVLAARQAFGRSALLLSGGANFGMNHIGVLKALWEHRLLPRIISGASAGSIVCSVLCVHTDEEIPEILASFCHGDLAVFEEKGSKGSILNKITRFLKYGSLYDVSLLTRVVRDMLGDITFQEAYNRTRRILNICVSSASLYELPRILNYITAPNVLIWSAVAASCSVPLLFTAATILAKDPVTGAHIPWNSSPQKWIDGSVDNDLPMTRLAEMFNVNHFIVSQVNPHVVPFIAKEEEAVVRQDATETAAYGLALSQSWLHTLTGLAKSETIHRMHTLIDFGFFPNTLTKTVSVLSQKYSGDITILPEISYTDFPTMMSNPSVDFMEKSMLRGERATWPKFSRIRNHLALELALDDAVQRLRTRVVFSASQADLRLGAYPPARSNTPKRNTRQPGRARTQHRRSSRSSELDPSLAHSLKNGHSQVSLDSMHSKARSINLPWPSTLPTLAAVPSPTPLSDVLSSGAETSNFYTSDSLADQSSSESPVSPSSPGDDWDLAGLSYSVPATPAAHRRLGSYLALTGPALAKSAGGPPSPSYTKAQAVPSAQETRYKRLFHGNGARGAKESGDRRESRFVEREAKTFRRESKEHHSQTTDPSAVSDRGIRGVKRFNALGLEIDLSGAKGVVRKRG